LKENKKKEIILVTGNKNRYDFIKNSLKEFSIKVNKKTIKLDEIQADDVKEIAIQKAINASKKLGKAVICEDTELKIKSLNGFPGPYLKFVQNKIKSNEILKLIKDKKDKTALFTSILVYAKPNGKTKLFETKLKCKIKKSNKKKNNQNWNNILFIEKTNKTLGELNQKELFELWNKGYKKFGKWYSKKL
jgi:XTP/dITP diphosphohydrolase